MWGPREQWSADGEIGCKSLSAVDPFVDPLTNASFFHSKIRSFEFSGLIESMSGPSKLRKFYIELLVRKFTNKGIPNLDQLGWVQVNLTCHAFPGRPKEKRVSIRTY